MVKSGQAGKSDSDIADSLIAQVRELIATLNIDPTVKNMQSSDFNDIAKAAAKSAITCEPTYLSAAEIKDILTKIKQASDEHASRDAKTGKVA